MCWYTCAFARQLNLKMYLCFVQRHVKGMGQQQTKDVYQTGGQGVRPQRGVRRGREESHVIVGRNLGDPDEGEAVYNQAEHDAPLPPRGVAPAGGPVDPRVQQIRDAIGGQRLPPQDIPEGLLDPDDDILNVFDGPDDPDEFVRRDRRRLLPEDLPDYSSSSEDDDDGIAPPPYPRPDWLDDQGYPIEGLAPPEAFRRPQIAPGAPVMLAPVPAVRGRGGHIPAARDPAVLGRIPAVRGRHRRAVGGVQGLADNLRRLRRGAQRAENDPMRMRREWKGRGSHWADVEKWR